MKKKKTRNIYFFIGTTAELIKVAPVIRELEKRKIDFEVISSNQNELHFGEMKHLFKKRSADYVFCATNSGPINNVYVRFTVWFVKSVGNYFLYFRNRFGKSDRKSPVLIVHGDTVTSIVGAIVAKVCGAELVHIESGLRSFNFLEPFPEELNRFIVSLLADVHFCPNIWAMKNLKSYGGKKISTRGNTVVETIKLALRDKEKLEIRGIKSSKYYVLVVHRQEHTLFNKKNTKEIINAMLSYANHDLKCVFIMHTLTEDYLKKQQMYFKIKRNKDVITPRRLSHVQFIKLMNKAEFIATDGGTNQEEAYSLGKPCLILRNVTERIEGLGENAVLSKNNLDVIGRFVENYKTYRRKRPKKQKSPSQIIVNYLEKNAKT